jgi:hypothetical protein
LDFGVACVQLEVLIFYRVLPVIPTNDIAKWDSANDIAKWLYRRSTVWTWSPLAIRQCEWHWIKKSCCSMSNCWLHHSCKVYGFRDRRFVFPGIWQDLRQAFVTDTRWGFSDPSYRVLPARVAWDRSTAVLPVIFSRDELLYSELTVHEQFVFILLQPTFSLPIQPIFIEPCTQLALHQRFVLFAWFISATRTSSTNHSLSIPWNRVLVQSHQYQT